MGRTLPAASSNSSIELLIQRLSRGKVCLNSMTPVPTLFSHSHLCLTPSLARSLSFSPTHATHACLGRLSIFTSGSENLHRVRRLTSGTRYALTVAFTCDSDKGVPDHDIMSKASIIFPEL